MALEGLRKGIFSALSKIKGKRRLDEAELQEMIKSLRRALQEADFNVRQTKELTERLSMKMKEEDPRPGITLQTHAMNIIYTELVRLLGPPKEIPPRGQTIMMVGLYGQGKTTTTAKLANWWATKKQADVAVIEADVHRPGAFSQLSQLLQNTKVKVFGDPDSNDAVDIVKRGIEKHSNVDILIIDTAGRHQLDEELVNELKDMSDLVKANERILVIDAQVGQAAGPVAASFNDLVHVTGVIVTKLDGTARGGGALSAVATTGSPILFTGEGENVKDIEKFESDRFISRLLGMGDIQGLIDLAPEDMDEIEAMRLTQRMMSGRFTLNDMYTQMDMMSKIGTLDKFLSFLPAGMFGGMSQMSRKQKEEMQGNLERYRTIMDSMTENEKNNPQILKAERIKRVARGSGVTEKNVRELIAQWNKSRKMMKGIQGNRKMSKQMRKMMKSGDFEDLSM